MPGPAPKSAATRQRRNRVANASTLEAPAATKVDLPTRQSVLRCTALVDAKAGCKLAAAQHDLEWFAKKEIEPHEFVGAIIEWHPLTVSWWETIWDSPMARDEWVDADVPQLVAIAFLVDEFWRTGAASVLAEIRLQNKEFGLSPLSRRSLQWEIQRVEAGARRLPEAPAVPRRRVRDPRSVLTVHAGGKSRAG